MNPFLKEQRFRHSGEPDQQPSAGQSALFPGQYLQRSTSLQLEVMILYDNFI